MKKLCNGCCSGGFRFGRNAKFAYSRWALREKADDGSHHGSGRNCKRRPAALSREIHLGVKPTRLSRRQLLVATGSELAEPMTDVGSRVNADDWATPSPQVRFGSIVPRGKLTAFERRLSMGWWPHRHTCTAAWCCSAPLKRAPVSSGAQLAKSVRIVLAFCTTLSASERSQRASGGACK